MWRTSCINVGTSSRSRSPGRAGQRFVADHVQGERVDAHSTAQADHASPSGTSGGFHVRHPEPAPDRVSLDEWERVEAPRETARGTRAGASIAGDVQSTLSRPRRQEIAEPRLQIGCTQGLLQTIRLAEWQPQRELHGVTNLRRDVPQLFDALVATLVPQAPVSNQLPNRQLVCRLVANLGRVPKRPRRKDLGCNWLRRCRPGVASRREHGAL
eukprot:719729-Prymnesium_polylepis.2